MVCLFKCPITYKHTHSRGINNTKVSHDEKDYSKYSAQMEPVVSL